MANLTTMRERIRNNCYEEVVKNLKKIDDDKYEFVDKYGATVYYYISLDTVLKQ